MTGAHETRVAVNYWPPAVVGRCTCGHAESAPANLGRGKRAESALAASIADVRARLAAHAESAS